MKTIIIKTIFTALLLCGAMTANAIPAQKGLWRMITLDDGTQVRVELKGDEFGHYWADAQGTCYNIDAATGSYHKIDVNKLRLHSMELRKAANANRALRMAKARKASSLGERNTAYIGKKKAIIILAQFTDTKFTFGHDQAFYNRIANELGFTSPLGFKGSVKDYFLAQSNGQFEIDFDVVGPYTLRHEVAYYGANTGTDGRDVRPGAMVAEACQAADADVNYTDYDWDGDGYVDQVFVLYAGKGEASGGSDDTVWPHEGTLSNGSYGSSLVTNDNGIVVNTYACGCELTVSATPIGYRDRVDGIGTICHEFSHCLGYPDLYDTDYGGNFGMGTWDLMSAGSYNGNSYCPPNFTAYEKWFAGWITPVELDKAATVKGIMPQDMHYGEAYIIYNDAHKDEYYLIENRQKEIGIWDSELAGSGLMITHVDYNKDIWEWNNVNTIVNYSETYGEQFAYLDNDHQRLTIFHADNSTSNEAGDLYPYNGNNSLTDTSEPEAKLYNGAATMGKPITNITQNEDGTIDFDFMGGSKDNIINGITTAKTGNGKFDNGVYSLDGRRVALSLDNVKPGIYIVNGKKTIKF